jgi:hypothetical protein
MLPGLLFILMEQQEILKALDTEWELGLAGTTISAEDIIHRLASRIAVLMDRNPDQFFLLMYRLDISEMRLKEVLADNEAAHKIAALVYQRQLQKIQSRRQHMPPADADPDLQW